jgi:DNA-binding beta-propeller fold protein YncE
MRTFTNGIVVRRLDATGAVLGDTTVSAALGVDGSTTAFSPDGRSLFAWNPATAEIDRIDLATGDLSSGQPSEGAAGAAAAGALDALAAWLAPSAAAKSFLSGGIVISPDGTRVYAVGIEQRADARDVSGSSGIFVFDAVTLASLAHWEPAADYISLGVSADGRYVYAAGLPRVDAAGTSRPSQQASITVHAAADGAVQVIAGQLGEQLLLFSDPVLR